MLLRLIAFTLIYLVPAGSGLHSEPLKTLTARVDQRVELLSIVFRLAGNFEYNMSNLDRYKADIDSYFGPYKQHPAVLLAKRVASRGVGFDAVMSMAVFLSTPPSLRPRNRFSADVPDSRWGEQDAVAFSAALAHFYADTRADRFFHTHEPLYALAVNRFDGVRQRINLPWFSHFYGAVAPDSFSVILGLNNGGGNYGPKVTLSDGRQEFYAIVGNWTHDATGDPTFDKDYLPMVVHEFNHSFVNPVVASTWGSFPSMDRLYHSVETKMKAQAYGDAQVMVDESLVRAAVILYLESNGSSAAEIQQMIFSEQKTGFFWMADLCSVLRDYEHNRSRYGSLADFMPQIATFFRGLPTT